MRAAGDLLTRAGFALPVADREVVEVRYASLPACSRDLRLTGATNILAQRATAPFSRTRPRRRDRRIRRERGGAVRAGVPERLGARPVSAGPGRAAPGTASLAEALKPKGSR